MGVLKPSGNGHYLLPHHLELPLSPTADSPNGAGPRVALTAQCDPVSGIAGSATLTCKACMPITPTVSQLARH
jgi:hypothetical protein